MQFLINNKAILRSFMVVVVSTMTSSAFAQMWAGGNSGGDGFGIGQDPRDQQGGWQQPCDNPYDPNCSQQQPGGGYGDQQTLYAQVGRTVRNERLNLKWYFGDLQNYRDWSIDSVMVDVSSYGYDSATISLVIDGRTEAVVNRAQGLVRLDVRRPILVGNPKRSIELVIQGSANIGQVQLQLERSNPQFPAPQPEPYPQPQPWPQPNPQPWPPQQPQPPQYGNQVVDLGIYTTVYSNSQIDLTRFVDTNRLRGWRVSQVVVQGRPLNNVSLVDVIANGSNLGTLQFDRGYSSQQTVNVNGWLTVDQSMRLWLNTRGDMTVERVQLILTR